MNKVAELKKVAASMGMTAADVKELQKMGVTTRELKRINAKLAPAFAKRDASKPGSKEEDEAVREIFIAMAELVK